MKTAEENKQAASVGGEQMHYAWKYFQYKTRLCRQVEKVENMKYSRKKTKINSAIFVICIHWIAWIYSHISWLKTLVSILSVKSE